MSAPDKVDAIEPLTPALEQKKDDGPNVAENPVQEETPPGEKEKEKEEEEEDTDQITGREPDNQELATLRRVSETIPLRAWYCLTHSIQRKLTQVDCHCRAL
jgi:hypothetical protein